MRIGVIGDIHCEHESLEAVLRFFQGQGVERILSVGDLCDGPGDVKRTISLLRGAGVEVVAGNHERWLLASELRDLPHATPLAVLDDDEWTWLSALPRTRELDTPRGRLLVCHGLGDNDMGRVLSYDTGSYLKTNGPLQKLLQAGRWRYVVNGHTHERMVRTLDGLTVITAGTLVPEDDPCFALLDFALGEVRFFRADAGRVGEALEVLPLPGEVGPPEP